MEKIAERDDEAPILLKNKGRVLPCRTLVYPEDNLTGKHAYTEEILKRTHF